MTATSPPRDQSAAYRQPVAEVLAALDTVAERGLTQAEARARLERYGRNELTAEKPIAAWRKFLAQFHDVLVVLLLVATAISAGLWLYERESAWPYEATAIFAVVLLNAVMGYVQQSRAEQAVAALRRMSAIDAHVIRDGARHTVPAVELVPGDVVLVEEGDTIPADARLIDSTALQTAEAALTGESVPVERIRVRSAKRPGSATVSTWSSAARRPRTATGARWWSQRACRPRWAASRVC
jgi:P-type Ca2+ transporter type 2C